MERVTGRLNADFSATDKLTVGAKILFSNVNQSVYDEGFTYTSPFYSSVIGLLLQIRSTMKMAVGIVNLFVKPMTATPNYQLNTIINMKNATRIQYALCRIRNHKNLKFKTTFSYDYTTVKGEKWYDPRTSNGEDENGEVVKRIREYKKWYGVTP